MSMRLLLGACVLIWAISATATPGMTAGTPLTLGQAIALVLDNNPQLRAADFESRAAADRVQQQSQPMPWELGVELENLAGSGQASGTSDLETTLSLGRVLELGDKSRLRGEVARFEAGMLRHEQDVQRLDLVTEAARRFIDIAWVQAERKLSQEQLELTRRTLKAVEKRFRVGKAPAAEHSRAQINLAQAELALEETDHLLANSWRQLSVLWGEFEPGYGSVQADLFRLEAEPHYAVLEQLIERNPALVRLATAERLADARLQLARASSRPDLDIRAGMRHFNDGNDLGLVLSLRMPLGSNGRARPYVTEADSLMQRQPMLAQEQRFALRATLFELHQEQLHARDRLTVYQERIIPAAEKALSDYSQGYAAGRYSLLELTSAQEVLLEARREVLSAAIDHHKTGVEIVRLTGATLTTGADQ